MPEGIIYSKMKDQHLFVHMSTELLRSGHKVRFQAPGRSMHPTIREGETITVEPIPSSTVKKGDIILYQTGNNVIAHRVVRIKKRRNGSPCFILRGDASTICDAPVEAGQILGKVTSVERIGHSIDLYGKRVAMMRMIHTRILSFKQWIIRILSLCRFSI